MRRVTPCTPNRAGITPPTRLELVLCCDVVLLVLLRSGCGNTLNCNHPTVRKFIVDCLRYWVNEYHVDGFRFDLASILTRAHSAWHPST